MLSPMKQRYCKQVMCLTCMQQCSHIVSVCHASIVRGCVPLSSSSSLIYHFWFLKHYHSAATPHHHQHYWHSCRAHENCMSAEQIIIFYILIFIFCSMYLVLFSIVLYRTIVTVYTGNIFLYNYLQQMHQIIHLSPVGCFTPAWGKTVQKNCEVSGVNLLFNVNDLNIYVHKLASLFQLRKCLSLLKKIVCFFKLNRLEAASFLLNFQAAACIHIRNIISKINENLRCYFFRLLLLYFCFVVFASDCEYNSVLISQCIWTQFLQWRWTVTGV